MTTSDDSVYDLSQLPEKETDKFEFKSSRVKIPGELEKKLQAAVSAFANSGGGVFVAGVSDKTGGADGGIPSCVGKEPLRDWADKIIHRVTPPPSYEIKYGVPTDGRGTINCDCVVLVVVVNESCNVPHMAPDNKYYIRAGVHTVPASHFLVEALWAKRHILKPRIAHLIRPKPDDEEVIQLGIVALTDSPVIDVEVSMPWPMPEILQQFERLEEFPLCIGVIDRHNPLFFDLITRSDVENAKDVVFEFQVNYRDFAGSQYEYKKSVNLGRAVSSLQFFNKGIDLDPIVRSLASIENVIAQHFRTCNSSQLSGKARNEAAI